MTKGIEEALNMDKIVDAEYTVEEGKSLTVISTDNALTKLTPTNNGKLDDSNFIRDTLKDLVDKTKEALDVALMIQEENPDYKNSEAVSKIADSVSKGLGVLIQLNKTEKVEAYRNRETEEQPKTVNNNLIVMTTQELIEKILNQTKQLKGK